MKIVIAMMKHETNTFSPIVTDWNRFENWGAYFGKKAFEVYENTGMPMAAYIDLAKEIKADIITPVAAEAMPSGIVTADTGFAGTVTVLTLHSAIRAVTVTITGYAIADPSTAHADIVA